MKQLEFFERTYEQKMNNMDKRIRRVQKDLAWLMSIEELRQEVQKQKTIEQPQRQMEMFG
jgi:hypothetical protein